MTHYDRPVSNSLTPVPYSLLAKYYPKTETSDYERRGALEGILAMSVRWVARNSEGTVPKKERTDA